MACTHNSNARFQPDGSTATSLESLGVSAPEPALLALGLESILTRFNPAERVAALAEASGVEPAAVEALLAGKARGLADGPGDVLADVLADVLGPDLWAGRLGLEEMLAWLRSGLDADLTEAHLMGLWSLAYEPYPAGIRLARAFAADPAVHAVVAVAAETPLYSAGAAAYLPEVEQVVARTYCTWSIGLARREANFYRAVAEDQAVAPSRCVLLDGDEACRAAAAEAGWLVFEALRD